MCRCKQFHPRAAIAGGTLLGLIILSHAGTANAAGGAFAVDNAGVDEAGSCKIETWASFARNDDRVFAVAPACAVSIGQPVEFGLQYDRIRADREWGSAIALKAKTSIVPFPDGAPFGVAIAGGAAMSLDSGKLENWFVAVPTSIRLSEALQLNLQLGGIWDRLEEKGFFTWGAGVEVTLTETVSLISEVFGTGSERPGAQAGLRFTPYEEVDFDLIYGRNLGGERSDWITFGMNLRF